MPKIQIVDGKLQFIKRDQDEWLKSISRVLFNGPPLSGKTTGLLTMPKPLHLLVAPGEQGYSSVQEMDDVKVYSIDVDESKALNYKLILSTFLEVVNQVMAGKHGPVATLAIDGIHQLYLFWQKSYGWPTQEDLWGKEAYGKGHNIVEREFYDWLTKVQGATNIRVIAATAYDGEEVVDKTVDKNTKGLYPDFPGKQAKRIMGKWPLVIHTKKIGTGNKEKFFWELQSTGEVRGVGVHLPKHIKEALPAACNPDWNEFEGLVLKHMQPAERKLEVVN